MTTLQLGDRSLTTEQIIPLLASYKLIPQFICESIIDGAIAPIRCTPEETAQASQEFYRHWELTSEAEKQGWREQYGMSQEQLEGLATRKLRVEKFKQATWGSQLERYFLKRKSQLDSVIYSLIRTKNGGFAYELYFRLEEGEQSFAELARQYSEGPEAGTGGLMGPVELGTLHPTLANILYSSQAQIGVVRPPIRLGELYVIIRVEKLIPAQLNNFTRQRLLQEKFEAWFQQQINQLPDRDKIWMGVPTNRQIEARSNLG
ncbi:peptidylprolyl isomerase [Dapis sp. BLCC M172]|uniref:peptidylprolyl isomerase n=1 Tax=Dapis sp. BLCC M172 TaxID=2975281 RepID=UPI003CF8DAED